MKSSRRLFFLLACMMVGVGLTTLAACADPYRFDATSTPTRTPHPSATPTPSPTPTPAWPIAVGCDTSVPGPACAQFAQSVAQDPAHFVWIEDALAADLSLTAAGDDPQALHAVGSWTYALAAPFFTLQDETAAADIQATWTGAITASASTRPLLMTADTMQAMISLWGPPAAQVQTTSAQALLTETIRLNGWSILPFDQLDARWKPLRVDGWSVLEKGLESDAYALSLPLYLSTARRSDALAFLPAAFSNRDEEEMSIVVMTGVTALTRGTAGKMEEMGITYPAQDIGAWLREADLTHISNEVSFTPDCPIPPILGGTTFCSHDRYIELLEVVGVDIVELTGNHNNDYGIGPNLHTLDMFRERGWQWFGGGTNLADATRPLTVTLGSNNLAFIGCNAFGPDYAWATESSPGAAPCKERADLDRILAQVADLRAAGWLPIVTVQAYETYEYFPTDRQREDFRALAAAGAVFVQGSQAHHPQGIEFYAGTFIHYGLGNLFFDQMQSLGTRQEFVDRLVFYDGKLLSVELLTALLEEYARPRPASQEERNELLQAVFAESGWGTE